MTYYENIQTDKKVELKKPFKYLGGKTKLIKTLLACVPLHKNYYELFTGGGTLFWAKAKADKNVLNDTSDIVYKTYLAIKYKPLELREELLGMLVSREHYRDIMKGIITPRCELEEVAFWLFTGVYSIFGTRAPYSFDDNLTNYNFFDRDFKEYSKKLQKVTISKRDAFDILRDIKDDKNAFIYLDPPYLDTANPYGCPDVTVEFFTKLASSLRQIKGKFLLSHLEHEEVAKAFSDFNISCVNTTYTMGKNANNHDGSSIQKQEYLISNYDLDPYLNADKLNLFKESK